MKKILFILLILLLTFAIFSPYLARYIEQDHNKVLNPGPYIIDEKTKKIHRKLLVADMHADPLLWARDLTKQWQQGHFDLPRMQQANLSLQVFGLVTKSPKGQNFKQNSADSDQLIPLVMAQHWPVSTWNSPFQRALFQAKRLHELSDRSADLTVIKNKADLNDWLKLRQKNTKLKAGMLGIEGAHALEANLNNFETLYQAGVRMIGMAHFFDNHFSGSAHGMKKGGLSTDGKALVTLAQSKGVLIDLAHVSPKSIDDILSLSSKPLVVSHTGVKATCNSSRNLSDFHIKQIARGRGLIGIAIFRGATCGDEIKNMVDAIDHVVNLVGVDYVGYGLDLDGSVTSPVDVSGMGLITQELLKRGYSESEIAKISGENFIRVLRETLL